MGTFEIIGNDKCNQLSATNTLELGHGNAITMDVYGEICSKKHYSTFKGSFEVIGGDGEFDNASGDGKISLKIGKEHFGGKLSGDILTS